MHTHFGPDFFSNNRARLRQAISSDIPIIVTANGVMQRSGDEPSPFHQDSNFWYLTGLDGADLLLVMTARDTYIIVPTLSAVREAFDGSHDLRAYVARSGITSFLSTQEGMKRLRAEVSGASEVATPASPPPHLTHHGVYSLPFRRRLITKLRRLNPALSFRDIRSDLATLRCIKQPAELRALQQAIDITCETLQEVTQPETLLSVHHEYEVEAALSYGFRKRGAMGHGFAPIVGAGAHSTTLHFMANNGPVENDDVLVLDVGAEVEHYSADISRTVSRQPFTGHKAEVFKAVASAQDYALSLIKPGSMPLEYEKKVEAFMGEELVKLGLIKDRTHANIRRYFPHATSHFLGLDIHDVGDYKSPWAENMVITCEPGIYIPEEGIGVRLEDDVLITAAGYKVLSAACPRELTPVQ